MDLQTVCTKAQKDHGLTQNELASRLGLTKQNLSAALHGRRGLPADAAFALEDLTGYPAREIYAAGKARAARIGVILAAIAVGVTTYVSPLRNADANQDVTRTAPSELPIMRTRRSKPGARLSQIAQAVARLFRSSAAPIPG